MKCLTEQIIHGRTHIKIKKNGHFLCVASYRVSTIKKFPTDMMDTLRTMVIQEPHHFLLLSRTKQELLVDKMVQRMVSSATFTDFIN